MSWRSLKQFFFFHRCVLYIILLPSGTFSPSFYIIWFSTSYIFPYPADIRSEYAGKRIPVKGKWNTFHHSITVCPQKKKEKKKACSVPEMRAPESSTFFLFPPVYKILSSSQLSRSLIWLQGNNLMWMPRKRSRAVYCVRWFVSVVVWVTCTSFMHKAMTVWAHGFK